ncbi:MAG: tellurium resistance TerZ family protein [Bacteroidia bacterium]|nr:tellurium resistance TerZ family protein [Bacteroidia bacterium]
MGINLDKKTGINLSKGSSISLEKQGAKLEHICVGVNWGAIQHSFFFNLFQQTETVDLDASVSLFDNKKNNVDTIFFNKLISADGAVQHSGDDRQGDLGRDDDLDNEVISVTLSKINPAIEQIVFFLNSFKNQDFAHIPYSKIRIYEGTPKYVQEVFATYNCSSERSFSGHVTMILAKLVRSGQNWEFKVIGEASPARGIRETIAEIQLKYL